jgi:CRISPR-associated endonuclease Csy4
MRPAMTNHYIDLRLLPDPELARAHLMGALFSKVHHALVAQGSEHIGISFPAVQMGSVSLGDRLRLHGDQATLTALINGNWLGGMRDHVHVTTVLVVPAEVRYCVVSRVQAKSNPERLRRRQMRRHGLSAEQALAQVPDAVAEALDLPYVQVHSQSTDESFRLFIRHGPLLDNARAGVFSAYGLSSTGTIPWF